MRVVSLLSTTAIVLSLLSTAYAAPDEQWIKTGPPNDVPSWGILMAEDTGTQSPIAELISVKADSYEGQGGKVLEVKACKDFTEVECPRNQFQRYTTPLNLCLTEKDANCVEEVIARDATGAKLEVNFLRNFPEENPYDYVGDSAANLPDGGTTFLVDIPGAKHEGGTTYLASVVLNGKREVGNPKFRTDYFNAQLFAVSLVKGNFNMSKPGLDPAVYTEYRNVNRSGDLQCSIQCSSTERAIGYSLPLDFTFGYKLRLSAEVTGWLNGRVSNVESSISKDTQGRQIVEVVGKPVIVPVIFGWTATADAPAPLLDFYNSMEPKRAHTGNGFGKCLDPNRTSTTPGPCNPIYWESTLRNPGKDLESLKEIALWLPILKDKAVAAPTMWLISSLGQQFNNGCSATTDRVSGIVTTNATGYVSGPPEFNKDDQTLDYKVISAHNLPDGSEFKGTYDLTIDADFARCIYGFSKAPIGASVSVVSADGKSQVATVVVSQKDKWIHLGAYGFTFSSPTLKVKFSQVAEPIATPSPTPSVTAKPEAKKVTISCVKGKTIKKVTAIKPTCPTGYKKK
ncbi:MAG: hypothetical protein ACKOPU_03595 [Candidatus Planktophila sp.]